MNCNLSRVSHSSTFLAQYENTRSHIFIQIKMLFTLKHMQHAVHTSISGATKSVVWCGLLNCGWNYNSWRNHINKSDFVEIPLCLPGLSMEQGNYSTAYHSLCLRAFSARFPCSLQGQLGHKGSLSFWVLQHKIQCVSTTFGWKWDVPLFAFSRLLDNISANGMSVTPCSVFCNRFITDPNATK